METRVRKTSSKVLLDSGRERWICSRAVVVRMRWMVRRKSSELPAWMCGLKVEGLVTGELESSVGVRRLGGLFWIGHTSCLWGS